MGCERDNLSPYRVERFGERNGTGEEKVDKSPSLPVSDNLKGDETHHLYKPFAIGRESKIKQLLHRVSLVSASDFKMCTPAVCGR